MVFEHIDYGVPMKALIAILMLVSNVVFGLPRSDDMIPAISKIPSKIWQTYKTKELPSPARRAQNTWLKRNGEYEYVFFDDGDIEQYIVNNWDDHTLAFFKALPLGVMKADLWRYLIITTEGGVYSDIDSVCSQSIRKWSTVVPKNTDHILLLGLENDVHFCQWTLAASSQHPAMKYVCEYIVDYWLRYGINLRNPHFVHESTGPGIWTDALSGYMGVPYQSSKQIYGRYLQDPVFKQHVNKLGIWLLPASYYAGECSQNLYGSQSFGDGYIRWGVERDRLSQ